MALTPIDRIVRLVRPRRTRIAWRALVAVLLLAAGSAVSWALKARDNVTIAAAQVLVQRGDKPLENAAPELLFAQAHELAQADRFEPALARYRLLYAHPTLGVAARYNSGNLLLRQAIALQGGENASQALPLVELAKQSYREVLRADPQHWDARYNHERAQRLVPDPDEIDAPIGEPGIRSERSPNTVRGVGGGMP